TDNEELNRAVAQAAEAAKVFVNVVDVPPLCSFIVPAVVRRGELTLAVSTGGASPAAARRLRQSLEGQFGPEWGDYLAILRAARAKLTALGRPADQNRPLFYELVDSELMQRVTGGEAAAVDEVLTRVLGPGFTLKDLGLELGQSAPEGRQPA
ncbi:MAG: bifunctional precorrin-2 dehydrogenase/sirohydrochlorin ferrochelatase, partial [Proteobacteria bacterium]|nr:bifunctional precorrin-2 dehydrogenase/sirohydrochlorin ferrochelatase [Pseudomonadota bacterium]